MKQHLAWIILFALVAGRCYGEPCLFYRVKSSSPAEISTFDEKGDVVWSNAINNATSYLEVASSITGPWCTYTNNSITTYSWGCSQRVYAPPETASWVPGEVLVGFVSGVETQEQYTIITSYGLTVKEFGWTYCKAGVTPAHEMEWIAILESDPKVRYAEPNYIVHIFDMTTVIRKSK
jgi:Fervidolysin N-terminal prodomain